MTKRRLAAYRLDPETIAGLEFVKRRDGVPVSEQVRRALESWLDEKGVAVMPAEPARTWPPPSPPEERVDEGPAPEDLSTALRRLGRPLKAGWVRGVKRVHWSLVDTVRTFTSAGHNRVAMVAVWREGEPFVQTEVGRSYLYDGWEMSNDSRVVFHLSGLKTDLILERLHPDSDDPRMARDAEEWNRYRKTTEAGLALTDLWISLLPLDGRQTAAST